MRSWAGRHPVLVSALAVAVAVGSVWVSKLVAVVRSVESSASYWSEPRGEPGGLLYVALGDSAAQGIGASSPSKGYVGVIAERLGERTGQPVEVVNLSASGARVEDVLERQLPALAALDREPDLLTVAIGGNDIRSYDRPTFAAEVDRLTAALPAGAFVADAPYFMHGRWQRDAQQAADLLTASAVERGLRPVPLHEALRAQGWQAMLTQYAADWFHPNDRGHRVWADAFWSEIERFPVAERSG
jgi:acyl-CoA thioesterase I